MTPQRTQKTGGDQDTQPAADDRAETTVEVRCTGHVRMELGDHSFEYTFEGTTLREFLEEFFAEYPEIESMIIASREEEATARGWAPVDDPPGTWRKNPEGEQTVAFARVMVNGRFNENLDGFDTQLSDGDRVALVYPFMFCL
ncbi:Molybdopterin converting factor, small subunit [Halalkaliarchaeum sp. AArc-CO]|uniref:MoaD/ThiS family protein n=1 Tax=unclassified Halalkaliarchaeum TaxID=2678344 RepID=UPI00217D35C7|nr:MULTISPECIES: MoaD/ThiS family protein [unclassified Halalkaliarchaeum]MDR5674098.1 MoaD/ThiS family protein [Halalkaliarchaeum sp. AArc-GB]UWG50817.1 Molybdopterin converting factor, small subunit [Halalkaliarchaeum sp. AArc-CO]